MISERKKRLVEEVKGSIEKAKRNVENAAILTFLDATKDFQVCDESIPMTEEAIAKFIEDSDEERLKLLEMNLQAIEAALRSFTIDGSTRKPGDPGLKGKTNKRVTKASRLAKMKVIHG